MLLEKFEVLVTADLAAYGSGESIGGLVTIARFFPAISVQAIIESITIVDKSKQAKDLRLVFFRADPANSTFTDQAALSLHDDDAEKFAGFVNFEDTDYIDFGGFSSLYKSGLNLSLKGTMGNPTLYLALMAREAVDFIAATDLTILITVRRD